MGLFCTCLSRVIFNDDEDEAAALWYLGSCDGEASGSHYSVCRPKNRQIENRITGRPAGAFQAEFVRHSIITTCDSARRRGKMNLSFLN